VLADGFKDTVIDGSGRVDVVVDPVGGDRFTDSLRCLRPDGRHVVVGFTGGDIPSVKVNRLLLANIAVVGAAWVGYAFGRPGHVASELAAIVSHLASGALRPVVGSTHPLEDASAALFELDERRANGKVLLLP
jgi:NADPH2:quinone reductase